MLKRPLAVVMLLTAPLAPSAAATDIFRAPAVIDTPLAQPLTEPRAASNPADADHVLVAAIAAPRGADDPWDCAVFASADGGASWSTRRLGIDRCIDPWLEFLDGETVIFGAIRIAASGQGEDRLRLMLSTSLDGGRTWETPVDAGRNFEHPIIVADGARALVLTRRGETSPGGQPRHYLELGAWEPVAGEYRPIAAIRPSNAQLTNTGFVRRADRTLYASFYDYGRNIDGFSDAGMLAAARAWGVRFGRDGSASVPLLITDRCGGQRSQRALFPGYPFLTRGGLRLYHACIGPEHGGVLFASSVDGESWTASRRVDASNEAGFALTPMLAANDSGGVLVAWQDRSGDPDCQRLMAVTSADSGSTFSAPLPLGLGLSCPRSEENARAGSSWPGGGDYSSAAVDRDGRFHIAWAETVDGVYRLVHAVIGAGE